MPTVPKFPKEPNLRIQSEYVIGQLNKNLFLQAYLLGNPESKVYNYIPSNNSTTAQKFSSI